MKRLEFTPDHLVSLYLDGCEAAASRNGGDAPKLLAYWPDAQVNKYQALLYSAAARRGFEILPLSSLDQLKDISWPGPVFFHAHWFAPIYAEASTHADALAANEATAGKLKAFKARVRARLLWTAHNLLPHGTPFPEAAREFRRWIVRNFDAVHLLAEEHQPILEADYGLPLAHAFTAPHPIYEDVYPDFVGRDPARTRLGIKPSQKTFLFFGSIQDYKNIPALLKSFEQLSRRRGDNVHLIIAGRPVHAHLVADAAKVAACNPNVSLFGANVPDEDVQYYFRAADAMVLPYADSLNSGAALLGLTFRLPVIAPTSPAFTPLRRRGVQTYDADAPEALLQALEHFLDNGTSPAGAVGAMSDLRPDHVSEKFFRQVDAIPSRQVP